MNYYEILGVDKKATVDEIKKAYKKKATKYHPDKNVGKSEAEKQKSEAEFKKINEAYETLGDEQKRKQYDEELNGSRYSTYGGSSTDDFFSHSERKYDFGSNSSHFDDLFEKYGSHSGFGKTGFDDIGIDIERFKRRYSKTPEQQLQSQLALLGLVYENGVLYQNIEIPFFKCYSGTTIKFETVTIENYQITGKKPIKMKIKPKTKNNSKLKLSKMGVNGGDLIVCVTYKEEEPPYYKEKVSTPYFFNDRVHIYANVDVLDIVSQSSKTFEVLDKKVTIDFSVSDFALPKLIKYPDMDTEIFLTFTVDYDSIKKLSAEQLQMIRKIKDEVQS